MASFCAKIVLLIALQVCSMCVPADCANEMSNFRDRQGNSVRIVDDRAYFQKAGESNRFPILTQSGHKIIKMDGDPQRGYIFFLSGNVVGRVLNPYGNLYVMFTSDVRICNETVVTYELVDGYITNDCKIDKSMGNMELKMGNYGDIQIKRSLLAYMLSKLDFAKSYYDDYFCSDANRKLFSRQITSQITTQSPVSLPLTIEDDAIFLPNNEDTEAVTERIVADVVRFHEMVLLKYMTQIESEEKLVYDKLNQKIMQMNRFRISNGLAGKTEDRVQPPKRSTKFNDDFKQFLQTKINALIGVGASNTSASIRYG